MSIKTIAVIHLEDGSDIKVENSISPMQFSIPAIWKQIERELDMCFCDWVSVDISIKKE